MSFRIRMDKNLAQNLIDDSKIYKHYLDIVKDEMFYAFDNEVLPKLEIRCLIKPDYNVILDFTSRVLLNNLISHCLEEREWKYDYQIML